MRERLRASLLKAVVIIDEDNQIWSADGANSSPCSPQIYPTFEVNLNDKFIMPFWIDMMPFWVDMMPFWIDMMPFWIDMLPFWIDIVP